MATRLFFHDAVNALSGTFPTTEQSTVGAPTLKAPTADTLRTMGSITGTSMVTYSITASATVAQQIAFCAYFCSAPLDSIQQIPPQPTRLNIANRENSANMNFGADLRTVAYAWRPSTGALVGYITDGLVATGDAEPAALSIRSNNCSVTSTVTISCAAGDVIICEIWQIFTQGVSTAQQGATYFDGTTITLTTGNVVTSHASFYELETSTLTFAQPTISGSFAVTLDTATVAATGIVKIAGAGSISCAPATLAGTGRVAISGTFTNTLAASTVAATGTVAGPFTFGNRSITLADATVAATGKVAAAGVRGISCAAATLVATGVVAVSGSKVQTLGAASVAATGTVVDGASGITGTRNVMLGAATLAATGVLGPTPPVPAPALPTNNSGGSGASSSFRRRKFIIPDLEDEPVKTLEDMLGIKREPDRNENTHDLPSVPVTALPIGQAVAASPPTLQYTSTLPLSSPVVVEEEEYSDEDLIHLLMMVT